MRSCFVPHCDGNNKEWKQRPMFIAPRNPELFAKWKAVLPKKRELKQNDKVCVRHFEDSDLITTYETLINGELNVIPRGRPKLNENAVPCKFLTDCDYPKRGRKYGKKPSEIKQSKKIVLKKVQIKSNVQQKIDIDWEQPNEQNEEYITIFDEESANKTDDTVENPDKLFASGENQSIDHENNKIDSDYDNINYTPTEPTEKQIEIFNSLYEDIFEVELPSTLWGIHRDPSYKFIALTYFDPDQFLTSKSIILKNTLKVEILLFNKYFPGEYMDTQCSIEDLNNILNRVDKFRLCLYAKESKNSCDYKLDENDEVVCKSCIEQELEN